MNESVRREEKRCRILDLQQRIYGASFDMFALGRDLLLEGQLLKLSRKEAQARYLFLFNDFLLVCLLTRSGYRINHVPRRRHAQGSFAPSPPQLRTSVPR